MAARQVFLSTLADVKTAIPWKEDDVELVQAEDMLMAANLRLEPILPKHAALLFEDLQAPQLYTYIPHQPPATLEALSRRYQRWAKRQADDGSEIWLNYAVYHMDEGRYLGTVQATVMANGESYIAYETFPCAWRRKIAQTACRALISHLFAAYPVGKVLALMDTRNEASWRLMESLQLRRTGFIAHADEFKGSISDEYRYEISREEWLQGC